MRDSDLAASFEEILGWPYASPGVTGDAGEQLGIDCSGAFVRAFRKHGAVIAHGSNTIFRKYCTETGRIEGNGQSLALGMAVFKRRDDGGEPAAYRGDGQGNLYHIGLVTRAWPLRIVHATPPVAKADTKLGNWAYYGRLKEVEYDGGRDERMEEKEPGEQAVVVSPDGNPVKLRPTPSVERPYLAKIPAGVWVRVRQQARAEDGEVWAQVEAQGKTGYMMARFLEPAEKEEAERDSGPEEGLLERIFEIERLLAELSERLTLLEGGGDGD